MREPLALRRFIPALLVVATGCVATKWQVQSAPAGDLLRSTAATEIRLTTTDGREIQLRHPVVEGDSIIGTSQQPAVGPPVPVGRQAVALSSVTSLAIKERDPAASSFLSAIAIVGLGLTALGVALAVACAGDCME